MFNKPRLWCVVALFMAIASGFAACSKKQPNEIKIGAILPLTGEGAKYGTSAKNGIELAISEINAAGGIHGKPLSAVYEDDQADPKVGVAAFQKLAMAKVLGVIGALPSSVTLALAPIAEKAKIALISPMSSNPKISDAGDFIFRNCISDLYEGSEMGKYAFQKLSLKKIAILYINNDYGIGLKDVFKHEFEALGGVVVQAESFDQAAADFRTQIAKIKSSNPDAIYLVGYNEMIQVFKQLKELRVGCQVLSTIMLNDPGLLAKMGDTAEGAILTAWTYDPKDAKNALFVGKFKEKYNTEPDVFAAQSYDTAKIFALAIEKGGESTVEVKNALYQIKDYPGVTGTTTFDEKGDVVKPLKFLKIHQGKFLDAAK